jgi:pectate lyase
MNDRMFETNFKSSHMITVDDIGTTREMTLLGMLSNTGCLRMKDININEIRNLSVVWHYDGDDVMIDEIYDTDSGEVYWVDHEENWSEYDEVLLCSLLMSGDLEC